MIKIHDITNTIFNSKTYILYKEGEKAVWIVDVGDIEPVLEFIKKRDLSVSGVFLTHAHFDHIYGVPPLLKLFPSCKVYTCAYAKQALASDRLNMSKYYGTPIIYEGDNVIVVKEGENMSLFENESQMIFYETPGHNPGCLTMIIGKTIFTGDAYIPGVGANTRLPCADKEQAKQSLERILKLAEGKVVLSGHQLN